MLLDVISCSLLFIILTACVFIEQRDAVIKKKGKQKITLKVMHYCYGGWEGCEVSNLQIVLFASLSYLITILDSETVVIDENTI